MVSAVKPDGIAAIEAGSAKWTSPVSDTSAHCRAQDMIMSSE